MPIRPSKFIFNLSATSSIANTFVAQLRDVDAQQNKMLFRRNLERIGESLAYEMSKTLTYKTVDVQTPLGISQCEVLADQPVIATILRAGLPLQQGVLNLFDQASCCFIAAYRKVRKNSDFIIQMDYVSTPDLTGKVLVMTDPMLATGQSMVICCKELMNRFKISELHIISAIASTEGIAHVRANLPEAKLWIGAIDEEMTTKAYIVPGLGDAGDLSFGEKI